MSRYVTTNLRLEKAIFRELRHHAQRRQTTVASVVREAVSRYLGRGADNAAIPFGDDPADELVGAVTGGARDEGVNHDR